MDTQALLLTLRLALATTAVLLAMALPLGYWLATTHTWAGQSVQALTALPLVLPPTVLGFYLLVLLGPQTLPGRLFASVLGHPAAFSFSGLLIGSVIYSFPFAVQPITAGFAAIDPQMLEAARLLGAGPLAVFRRVLLPLSRRSLVTAAVLAFAHTVGEFGVVLMIGGGIPGSTRTLSIVIYDQVQDFAYAAANRTALLLLGFSFTALLGVYLRPRGTESGDAALRSPNV
jgi:molybdate transport system permease protein